MGLHCKHCGKNEIDEEDEICHNCGVVSEGLTFDETYNPFSTESKNTYQRYAKKKPTEGLRLAVSMLNMLCQKYSVSGSIKSSATELLNKIYPTKCFRRKADFGVLAGCCLVHYMKLDKIHVPIVDLCKKLQCPKKLVYKYTNFVKDYVNNGNEGCIVDEVKTEEPAIIEMTFDEKVRPTVRSYLENVSVENKDVLIEKVVALTKLANSLWLISGRSTEAVVCAAAFLCWRFMNPGKQPSSLQWFCNEFSLPYKKAMPRAREMRDMLLKLGQNIPSVSKNYVTEKNVLFHLDYILEHSETLRNDLLPSEFTTEEVNKKEFTEFRRDFPRAGRTASIPSSVKMYPEDMRASEIEISDTEISSYIRTDDQVQMIKSLQKVPDGV